MIGHCHIRKFAVLYSQDNAQQFVKIREWTNYNKSLSSSSGTPWFFLACEYWRIYSTENPGVKSYCVDQKNNWKTIYPDRVIGENVTQNRSWCNQHQLSPCSNRHCEMWSIRYFWHILNCDSITWNQNTTTKTRTTGCRISLASLWLGRFSTELQASLF